MQSFVSVLLALHSRFQNHPTNKDHPNAWKGKTVFIALGHPASEGELSPWRSPAVHLQTL
jgi:hypothetical protein